MHNKTIMSITLSGAMTALAVVFGVFVHFPFAGSNVSLVVIIIGLLPFVVRFPYALMVTGISVVLTDVINGWAGFAWISLIAYLAFTIIHYFGARIFLIRVITLLTASLVLTAIYFALDWFVFDPKFAIKDLIATSVQMAISFPIILILIPIIKNLKLRV